MKDAIYGFNKIENIHENTVSVFISEVNKLAKVSIHSVTSGEKKTNPNRLLSQQIARANLHLRNIKNGITSDSVSKTSMNRLTHAVPHINDWTVCYLGGEGVSLSSAIDIQFNVISYLNEQGYNSDFIFGRRVSKEPKKAKNPKKWNPIVKFHNNQKKDWATVWCAFNRLAVLTTISEKNKFEIVGFLLYALRISNGGELWYGPCPDFDVSIIPSHPINQAEFEIICRDCIEKKI